MSIPVAVEKMALLYMFSTLQNIYLWPKFSHLTALHTRCDYRQIGAMSM